MYYFIIKATYSHSLKKMRKRAKRSKYLHSLDKTKVNFVDMSQRNIFYRSIYIFTWNYTKHAISQITFHYFIMSILVTKYLFAMCLMAK